MEVVKDQKISFGKDMIVPLNPLKQKSIERKSTI
jgi:hypothetical protein